MLLEVLVGPLDDAFSRVPFWKSFAVREDNESAVVKLENTSVEKSVPVGTVSE